MSNKPLDFCTVACPCSVARDPCSVQFPIRIPPPRPTYLSPSSSPQRTTKNPLMTYLTRTPSFAVHPAFVLFPPPSFSDHSIRSSNPLQFQSLCLKILTSVVHSFRHSPELTSSSQRLIREPLVFHDNSLTRNFTFSHQHGFYNLPTPPKCVP